MNHPPFYAVNEVLRAKLYLDRQETEEVLKIARARYGIKSLSQLVRGFIARENELTGKRGLLNVKLRTR